MMTLYGTAIYFLFGDNSPFGIPIARSEISAHLILSNDREEVPGMRTTVLELGNKTRMASLVSEKDMPVITCENFSLRIDFKFSLREIMATLLSDDAVKILSP